jgi:hypothetical protein
MDRPIPRFAPVTSTDLPNAVSFRSSAPDATGCDPTLHNLVRVFWTGPAYRGGEGDSLNSHPNTPVTITSARPALSADIRRREIRYLLSMGIRTACFVLAIVTDGPVRWVLVAGAVFLPYIAVVLANATDRRSYAGPPAFHVEDRPRLEAQPSADAPHDVRHPG